MATVSDLPYMSDGEYGYYRFNAAIKSAYDYYPFGSLKPGRYTSDTSSNCVTLTQNKWVTKYRTDSVWVNHTLVVRQAPTILNVNTIAN